METQTEVQQAGKLVGLFFAGVFGMFVVGFVVVLVMGGFRSEAHGAPTDHEIIRECQGWVQDQLRSPATAKFSGERVQPLGSSSWSVTGQVDAENGFGASTRTGWMCSIRLDGDTWRGSAYLS